MRRLSLLALICPLAFLASCSSSSTKIKGLPANLPSIPVYGSASTPSHGMPHEDYPFDSSGNYVTSWAAEGGDRPGSTSTSSSRSTATRYKSSSSKSRGTSSSKSKAKTTSSRRHTVRSSDSLWSIARKYGTTVAKIKAANGMKSDVIRDGRSLIIPR